MTAPPELLTPHALLWQAVTGTPPVTNPTLPIESFDFWLNVVMGNFGLTVFLLWMVFRCLRRVDELVDAAIARRDREKPNGA
jgi:hypothetical protein